MKHSRPSPVLKEKLEEFSFMEESMTPDSPSKYQEFCRWNNQDHFITPWNIHSEVKKEFQAKKNSIYPAIRTPLPLKTRLESKNRNSEVTY